MIMRGRIGDGEIQPDRIEKRRIGQRHPVRGKIRRRPEHQTIPAYPKRIALQQRRRTPPVVVRNKIQQRRAIAAAQPPGHPGRGYSPGRVQNMRGQSPHTTLG